MLGIGRRLSFTLLLAVSLFGSARAWAQGASTGALTGIVTDVSTGAPIAGVTVVAQGPQGEQGDITDDEGRYTITGLVPGAYVVRMFYGNVKVERQNVQVFADKKIQVNVPLQIKTGT